MKPDTIFIRKLAERKCFFRVLKYKKYDLKTGQKKEVELLKVYLFSIDGVIDSKDNPDRLENTFNSFVAVGGG